MTATLPTDSERAWELKATLRKYDDGSGVTTVERKRRDGRGLRSFCRPRLRYTEAVIPEGALPVEVVTSRHNLLLNVGIAKLLDQLIGATTAPYDAAHSRLGVGNDATAAAASQTDLQAAAGAGNRQFKLCSSGPTRASQTVTWVAAFATGEANFAWAEFCVDESTEIMTAQGWRRYDEISEGDLVLGMNPESMIADWEPLAGVAVWPARPRQMRLLDGQGHSSLTTLDHRWLVWERRGRNKVMVPRWRTSETLTSESRIPRSAPFIGAPTEAKYSDAFVQIVGWYWTEGWFNKRDRPGLSGVIGQSHVVNPTKVARIRALLAREFGSDGFTERQRHDDGMTYFRLPDRAMRALLEVCGQDKAPSVEFILALTDTQIASLINTCLDGDGHRSSITGQTWWAQTSEVGVRRFEMLCALAGIPTHTTGGTAERLGCHKVALLKRDVAMPVAGALRNCQAVDEIVNYDGLVWCPQTPSTTWLARRNGTVYWTGNCVDFGTADGTTAVSPLLNRKVSALGTKASGVWTLTATLTIS